MVLACTPSGSTRTRARFSIEYPVLNGSRFPLSGNVRAPAAHWVSIIGTG